MRIDGTKRAGEAARHPLEWMKLEEAVDYLKAQPIEPEIKTLLIAILKRKG